MNKLGFVINYASEGVGNAIECNKGQWINKVVDIREYLKLFNGLQGTDNFVTFMSFDEGGCFLTQLRAISGRVGDFLSGWIYIPNTIEASGEDIMSTYYYVRNILSQSSLNGYFSDIESFFSKEYPEKEYTVSYVPSSGEDFGVRYNDKYYSMKEILDADRYQPYYSKYKAIFLLDKDGEVKISKEQKTRFKDLTQLKIDKTCVFKAPSSKEVLRLGRGAKVVFQDNIEFKSPVLRKKGDKIQLYATRVGFEPVALPLVVIQEDVQVMSIEPVKWYKRIKPSMFVVCNRNNDTIRQDVHISINGIDVTYQEALVSEEDCRQAIVNVSATDYETSEENKNLLNDESYKIVLNRKIKSFTYKVELANGKSGTMTIKSKYLSSHESPLKGYDYEHDSQGYSILKITPWFVWKQRLLGALGGLGVLALILLSLLIYAWIDNGCPMPWDKKKEPSIEATTPNETDGQESHVSEESDSITCTLDDAVEYLDKKKVWKKSEMDKYPDLQGLFEDMNSFNLSRLLNEWSIKLASSQKFKKVYESANKTHANGWNPSQNPHKPTYNLPTDEKICVQNYINWLDHDQTPPATDEGSHSNTVVEQVRNRRANRGPKADKGSGKANNDKSGQGNKDKKDIFN